MPRIGTVCVQEGKDHRTTAPHQVPIYATSSFQLESVEEGIEIFKDPSIGHLYARFSNPTIDTVAEKIAHLEAHNLEIPEVWGILTSSGMSAISTVLLSELSQHEKVLTQGNLYGGTTELVRKALPPLAIEPVFVDLTDIDAVKHQLEQDDKIRVIYLETPSNPALDCVDLESIGRVAKSYDVKVVVDNTFCTPVIQQPLKYGVDYVIHSTTKYINGHGNGISGVIIGRTREGRNKVWSKMKLLGTNCNPWDAWLINNGIKTLALRMKQHSANAMQLATHLSDHPKVASVNYLGLKNHKFHKLAQRQMSDYGGMMCFEVEGGIEAGIKIMNALSIGKLAPTMGDVDTLLMHPASMSHLNVPKDMRMANGISDGLIRVSVGIESIEDLVEDFDRALGSL